MNRKGFTLVEILSVLVLIGLLLGLAIPGINKISSNMKKKSYNKKISLVENAAELWGQDNKTLLQSSINCEISNGEEVSCYKIKIGDLIGDNYLDSDNNSGNYINPTNNSDMKNSCVYVYKKNNRVYSYFVGEDSNKCLNDKSFKLLYSGPKVTTDDNVSSGVEHDNNSFTFVVEKDNIPWTNYIIKIKTDTDEDYKDFVRDTKYFSNRYNNTKNVDFYFKYCNKERENECTDETKYVTNLNIPGPELTITPKYSGGWTNEKLTVTAKIEGESESGGYYYFDGEQINNNLKEYNNVEKNIFVKKCSTSDENDCTKSTKLTIKTDTISPEINLNGTYFTVEDNISGVFGYFLSKDKIDNKNSINSWIPKSEGQININTNYIYAKDNAGNIAEFVVKSKLLVQLKPVKNSISKYQIEIRGQNNIKIESAKLTVKDSKNVNYGDNYKNLILSDTIIDFNNINKNENKGLLEYDFITELSRKYDFCDKSSNNDTVKKCVRSTVFSDKNLNFENELEIKYLENGNIKTEKYSFNSQLNILARMGREYTADSYNLVYVNKNGDYIYYACDTKKCSNKDDNPRYELYNLKTNSSMKLIGIGYSDFVDLFTLNNFDENEVKFCIESRSWVFKGGTKKKESSYYQHILNLNTNYSSVNNITKNSCNNSYTNPSVFNNWYSLGDEEGKLLKTFVEFEQKFTKYTDADGKSTGYTKYEINTDNTPKLFKNKKFLIKQGDYKDYYGLIMYGMYKKSSDSPTWNTFLYYKPEVTLSSNNKNIIINTD